MTIPIYEFMRIYEWLRIRATIIMHFLAVVNLRRNRILAVAPPVGGASAKILFLLKFVVLEIRY